MSWSNSQKALIHIYRNAAGIPEAEYRQLLLDATGSNSAASAGLGQADFESAMAAMEGRLSWAVQEGVAKFPDHGRIRELNYWRTRKPDKSGQVTTRQLRLIGDLLRDLGPFWVDVQDKAAYTSAIIRHAIGRDIGVLELKSHEASALIDALKDHLAHHQKRAAKAV